MDPGEVLAVELPQFVSESGLRTIVPRVIGQTAEAQQKKGGPRTRNKWDEASFFAKLQATGKAHEIHAARQILAWAGKHVSYIWWGEGKQIGSFVPILLHQEQKYQLFALYTNGYLEIYFQWLQLKPPFDSEEKRLELLQKLNEIPGVNLPQDAITRRPSIHLQTLSNQAKVQQLVKIFDWVVAGITN